jgi:hypothetical protein
MDQVTFRKKLILIGHGIFWIPVNAFSVCENALLNHPLFIRKAVASDGITDQYELCDDIMESLVYIRNGEHFRRVYIQTIGVRPKPTDCHFHNYLLRLMTACGAILVGISRTYPCLVLYPREPGQIASAFFERLKQLSFKNSIKRIDPSGYDRSGKDCFAKLDSRKFNCNLYMGRCYGKDETYVTFNLKPRWLFLFRKFPKETDEIKHSLLSIPGAQMLIFNETRPEW